MIRMRARVPRGFARAAADHLRGLTVQQLGGSCTVGVVFVVRVQEQDPLLEAVVCVLLLSS